jgi:hypothetical protein
MTRHVPFVAAGWPGFLCFVILALGTLPIIGTYPVFSHTADEPARIAAGMELLDRGTFTYEQQHPPLAHLGDEGLAIFYTSGDVAEGCATTVNISGMPAPLPFSTTTACFFAWNG